MRWRLALAVLLLACSGPGPLPFRAGAPLPAARQLAQAASVGGRLFFLGGFVTPSLKGSREVLAYDPQADRWQTHPDLPEPLTHAMAAVEEDRFIWVAGGFVGDAYGEATAAVRRYDTQGQVWSDGPPLPQVRASGGLVMLDGKLHYFGGTGADHITDHADHWVLELTGDGAEGQGVWQEAAPLPVPRVHFAAVVAGGKIYAFGGHTRHDGGSEGRADDLDLAQVYDPATDRWSRIAALPASRSHMETASFAGDGKVWTLGGRDNDPGFLAEVWEKLTGRGDRFLDTLTVYDPATGEWRVRGRVPDPLNGPSAGFAGGSLVIAGGGRNGWENPQATTWVLDRTALRE